MEMQKVILKILQGWITDANGDNVPVVVRHFPLDKTPCITINSEGARPIDNAYVMIEPHTVEAGHPDYDEDNPDKLVPQDVYYQQVEDTIIINLWYTDKNDGYTITEQVRDAIFMARTNHYRYCLNYDKNTHTCSTDGLECHARTSKNGLAVKCLCPNREKYNYRSIFTEHLIRPTLFKIESILNQDEYDERQTLYRRIIKLDVTYYYSKVIGGKMFGHTMYDDDMEVNDNGS